MTDERKKILFEKTLSLEKQKKEAEVLSEFDFVRDEIERRYFHNLDMIILNGLQTEYYEYKKRKEF